jgi:hypothetical protein
MKQIPRGPEHLYCPYWRKKMSAVCHTCPQWVQLRGANPNTGEPIDRWDCAQALLPLLLLETAQQVRQGGAATESFRNEMVRIAEARRKVPVMIEGE